jgi:hypothetical protein
MAYTPQDETLFGMKRNLRFVLRGTSISESRRYVGPTILQIQLFELGHRCEEF